MQPPGGDQLRDGYHPGKLGTGAVEGASSIIDSLTLSMIEKENRVVKFEWPRLGGNFYICSKKRMKDFAKAGTICFAVKEMARILVSDLTQEDLLNICKLKQAFGAYISDTGSDIGTNGGPIDEENQIA